MFYYITPHPSQFLPAEDELTLFWCHLLAVLTGTLVSAAMREQSVLATFSVTNLYKEGNLSIQQAGKSMSAKVIIPCKKCPLVRRGEWIGRLSQKKTSFKHRIRSRERFRTLRSVASDCSRRTARIFIYRVAELGTTE